MARAGRREPRDDEEIVTPRARGLLDHESEGLTQTPPYSIARNRPPECTRRGHREAHLAKVIWPRAEREELVMA